MAIRNVVKVMNFHSLLRVDKSRRKAVRYLEIEKELFKIIKKILFNKNLILDKNAIVPDPSMPILNIYIGNDLGFCGDFNFSINKDVRRDKNYKILVGRKIHSYDHEKVVLAISKEQFLTKFKLIENVIYDAIIEKKYSEINIIYNHYYNVNNLQFTRKRLFPLEYSEDDDEAYDEDYAMETDIKPMLNSLIALYICYEIKICEMSSYAAENVIRQQITNESLKKIDEITEEKEKHERKLRKQKDFQEIIENYRKE